MTITSFPSFASVLILGWTLVQYLSLLLSIEHVQATLSPENVSENPCLSPEPESMRPSMQFLLSVASRAMTPFYVPLGSQQFYRSSATYLLGRPPATQEELDRMNLRIQGSPTNTWITTGYDQRFIQQCVPALEFFKSFCLAGLGSEQTNLSPIRRSSNTLVWTDNKTSALFTRCAGGLQNDWFVLSMTPTLERETMKEILRTVLGLGYNATLAARARY